MNDNDRVEILLATYNGERYIEEQLASIARQTFRNVTVILRDDGSPDGTVEVVRRYSETHPGLISDIIVNDTDVHGASANFAALLERSAAEYVMFCDQDDVWLGDKVEKTLNAMKKAESEYPGAGIAVHTDLYVTDTGLNITAQSFFEADRIVPQNSDLASLLVSNTLTGCTVMINRRLAEIIGKIPPEAAMHDSWIALCASAFGKIVTLYEPTMYYRQHSGNVVGVTQRPNFFARLSRYLFSKEKAKRYGRTATELYRAADCFAETYSGRLTPEQYGMCRAFADMKGRNALSRLFTILKYGFGGKKLVRRLKAWLLLNKAKHYDG